MTPVAGRIVAAAASAGRDRAGWRGRSCSRSRGRWRRCCRRTASASPAAVSTDCGDRMRTPSSVPPFEQHPADPGQPARRNAQARPAARTRRRCSPSRQRAEESQPAPSRTNTGQSGRLPPRSSRTALPSCVRTTARADRAVAARRPVEAGVELHGHEHLAPHQPVEPLAGHLLDHRRDDREIEVRVSEIAGAGRMAPRPSWWARPSPTEPNRRAGSHIGRRGRAPSWCATAALRD